MSGSLADEAEAFDRQILDRVKNGHLPDLRRSGRCDWFRNNIWRDGAYVDLVYGEIVRWILGALPEKAKILEVGCGPGHVSLELARNGHDVFGVDVSKVCIDVAERVAAEDPWMSTRGKLEYFCGALEELTLAREFDAVVFVGALHHFPDVGSALDVVEKALKHSGLLFVSEPSRDDAGEKEALILFLIQQLLRAGGKYFASEAPGGTPEDLSAVVHAITEKLTYRDEHGNSPQSPHDNEAGFKEILQAVQDRFDLRDRTDAYGILDQVIGGLRCASPEEEHRLARWIKEMDSNLVRVGVLCPRWVNLQAVKR